MTLRCVVVGTGRAGASFSGALARAGWDVSLQSSRRIPSTSDVDLVVIAVSDHAISSVAQLLAPTNAVVVHVSGATGLDVLAPHERVGSIHPLMSLPSAEVGTTRLLDDCTFAVAGDPFTHDVVTSLGGRAVDVADADRALYHATAAIAANHFTALCAQVERLASLVGVPVDAYWKMMATTLDNVAATGAASALTGPAARGDWETIRTHLAALPLGEQPLYRALCRATAALGDQELPPDLDSTT